MKPTRLTYSDKAGSHRQITYLQEKILRWRLDHADKSKSECARTLKCSYTAVQKTERNPACIAFVDEIKAMVKKALVLDYEEKRRILAVVARTDVTQFTGPGGTIQVTADNPSRQAVAELQEDTIGHDDGEVVTHRKIKLINKLDAIDLDNKMEKLYSEAPQVAINAPTFNIAVIDSEAEGLLKKLLSGQRGVIEATKE